MGLPETDHALTQALSVLYGVAQADFNEGFKLRWEFRVVGDTEVRTITGQSVNPFYVTYGTPAGDGILYHTVVHVGCVAAKGQTSNDAVFDAIWAKFKGRTIKSVKMENGSVKDNQTLAYYGKDIRAPLLIQSPETQTL